MKLPIPENKQVYAYACKNCGPLIAEAEIPYCVRCRHLGIGDGKLEFIEKGPYKEIYVKLWGNCE